VPPGAGIDPKRVTGQAREKGVDECFMDRISTRFAANAARRRRQIGAVSLAAFPKKGWGNGQSCETALSESDNWLD
jgi:hypothetical protein